MIGKILQYVLARLTEKTSLVGYVTAIAAAIHWQLTQQQADSTANLIAAIVSVILVFIPGDKLAAVVGAK